MQSLPGTRRLWGYPAVVSLIEFVHGGLLFVLLPVHLRGQLGLPLGIVGLALSIYGLTDLALKVPAGWLVDRAGSRAALLVATILSLVSLGVLSRAGAVWTVLLGCAIHGAGSSPVWPAAVSGATGRAGQRGLAMGQIFTAWLSGTGLGAATIAGMLSAGSNAAFVVLGGAALSAAAVTLAVVPGGRATRRRAAAPAHVVAIIGRAVRRLHLLALGMFLQTFAGGMLVPVLVPYARDVLHLSHAQLILLLTAGPGLTVLLLIPLGRLADRLGPRRVVGGGVILAPLVLWAVPSCGVVWCLAPLAAALGAGYALVLPAWNAVVLDRVPQQGRGVVLSFVMALEGLGAALGPAAGGRVADLQGPAVPFRAAALALAAAAVLYHVWRRQGTRGLGSQTA